PSNPFVKITQLTKQVEEQNIQIIELKKINSKLKEDYKKIKANLIARQVLDRDMEHILE
ncbi:19692_t:CDS:1, partial [Dentiscutata erythropus]